MRTLIRFTFTLCLLALPVLAQEPTVEPSSTTPMGILLMGLATLGGLALTAALGAVGLYFSKRAKDGAAWSLANRLWVAMQHAVTHAEAEIRPELQKALADGKLTPEEAALLKSRALAVFKGIAGDLLAEAPKVLGFNPAGMPAFLSGMLERAVAVMKSSPAVTTEIGKAGPKRAPTPTVKEAAAAVAEARLNPPAETSEAKPEEPPAGP
jgi:hypothetical protein